MNTKTLIVSTLFSLAFLSKCALASTELLADTHTEADTNSPAAIANDQNCAQTDRQYFFKSSQQNTFNFVGTIETEVNGSTSSMLYPAPNMVGFLAAVATHAILAGSQESAEKRAQREKADKVLEPLKPIIEVLHPKDLLTSFLSANNNGIIKKQHQIDVPVSKCDFLVSAESSFLVTQDKRSIIIETVIVIGHPDSKPEFQNLIRVISPAKPAENIEQFWLDVSGKNLKEETQRLFNSSLDALIGEYAKRLVSQAYRRLSVIQKVAK